MQFLDNFFHFLGNSHFSTPTTMPTGQTVLPTGNGEFSSVKLAKAYISHSDQEKSSHQSADVSIELVTKNAQHILARQCIEQKIKFTKTKEQKLTDDDEQAVLNAFFSITPEEYLEKVSAAKSGNKNQKIWNNQAWKLMITPGERLLLVSKTAFAGGASKQVRKAYDLSDETEEALVYINWKGDGFVNKDQINEIKFHETFCKDPVHPGLVQTYEVWQRKKERSEFPHRMKLIQPYYEGGTLQENTRYISQLEPDKKINLMIQFMEGIRYLHDKKYIHRDIKLENVLVQPSQDQTHSLKITDFGTAIPLGNKRPGEKYADAEGTAQYQAPNFLMALDEAIARNKSLMSIDQARDLVCQQVGPEADIYAAGIVLYAMATGKTPSFLQIKHPSQEEIEAWRKECEASSDPVLKIIAKMSQDPWNIDAQKLDKNKCITAHAVIKELKTVQQKMQKR